MSFLAAIAPPFRRAAAAAILLVTLCGSTHAAPLQRDLGQNLAYHRAHTLPAELPDASAKAQPLVLDLRFTLASEGAAAALTSWLRVNATRTTPVIVLVNAETAPALHTTFASLGSQPGLLVIGSAASGFIPDIALPTSLEAERRAYQALADGASLDSLLREHTDKPRHDEAAIMRERTNPPEDPEEDELSDDPPQKTASEPPPPRTIDFALQRAVQLHRALLALNRL